MKYLLDTVVVSEPARFAGAALTNDVGGVVGGAVVGGVIGNQLAK